MGSIPFRYFVRGLFFVLGITLLYFLIQKFGASELLLALRGIGFNIVYVLMVPLAWLVVQTRAWQLTVEETGSHLTFWELFTIKMSGDAANTLTPLGFMGGDPVRFSMLKKKMPGTLSAVSVVLDRTMQSLAVVSLLVLSLILASLFLSLPTTWRILFPLMTVILILLLWFFIHHQTKGIFEPFFLRLRKLKIKTSFIDQLLLNLGSLDERISKFYRHDRRRFFACYGYHFIGRLLGVFEIYLIAHLLSIPLSFLGALYMASLAVLVNILFVFIPGSMGVMEGAYGALCLVLGLYPVSGVAIQLVRRLRAIFWISLGVLFMIIYSPSPKQGLTKEKG